MRPFTRLRLRQIYTMSSFTISKEKKARWDSLVKFEAERKGNPKKGKPSTEEIQKLRDHRQRKKYFLSSLSEQERLCLCPPKPKSTSKTKPPVTETETDKVEAEKKILRRFAVSGSPLVDIGINLHTKLAFPDLEEKLLLAAQAGVGRVILTGCSLESCGQGREACEKWYSVHDGPKVYHTVGIHPHDAKTAYVNGQVDEDVMAKLRVMADHPYVVSMGECGLDYDRMFSTMEAQRAVFEAQARLAAQLNKPLFVHLRERDADKGEPLGALEHTSEILKKVNIDHAKVCVHCFTGDATDLKKLTGAGYKIGLTGYVGMAKRAARTGTLDAIRNADHISLDQLLIETDSPYMKPDKSWFPDDSQLRRSKSNEPASMPAVCRSVAATLHGGAYSEEVIAARTTQNAETFFGFAVADELIQQLQSKPNHPNQ